MKNKKILSMLGWIGIVLILIAYGFISFNIIYPHSLLFHTINLFGAFFIALSSYSKKDYNIVVLNCIWMVISAASIVVYST